MVGFYWPEYPRMTYIIKNAYVKGMWSGFSSKGFFVGSFSWSHMFGLFPAHTQERGAEVHSVIKWHLIRNTMQLSTLRNGRNIQALSQEVQFLLNSLYKFRCWGNAFNFGALHCSLAKARMCCSLKNSQNLWLSLPALSLLFLLLVPSQYPTNEEMRIECNSLSLGIQ